MTTQAGDPARLIEVSRVGRIGLDELLRLVAADPSSEEVLLKQQVGLTAWEAEVLLWLGRREAEPGHRRDVGAEPADGL